MSVPDLNAALDDVVRANADPSRRAAGVVDVVRRVCPGRLHACFLSGSEAEAVCVVDAKGSPLPAEEETLRPLLQRLASEGTKQDPALKGLCAVAVSFRGRTHGVIAVGLRPRASEAAARDTLVGIADRLALLLDAAGQKPGMDDLPELANAVAHDFNNTLNSISLHAAMLERRGVTPAQTADLAAVRREVSQAGQKVRRLQDVCRRGQAPLRSVDLNETLRAAASARAANVVLELADGLPPVLGTPEDGARLLDLLVGAAGPGPVVVRSGIEEDQVFLRVEGRHTRPQAVALADLFEPFAGSGDDNRLVVARMVVRRFQGDLRAEESENGGLALLVHWRRAENTDVG